MTAPTSPARFRFSDSARTGLLLGLGMRQAAPLVLGVLWLTVWLMAQLPLVGMVGPLAGAVVAFGRWKRAPLYDVAIPGVRLIGDRWLGRRTWTKAPLIAAGPGLDDDVPPALRGLELLDADLDWPPGTRPAAVVADRVAGTVSLVVAVRAAGFAVASPVEQDGLVAAWGAALAPLARALCPVSRVTWQEWSHPSGIAGHRAFLDAQAGAGAVAHLDAAADYEALLAEQAPFTASHEVHLTITVDQRRVRRGRAAAIAVLTEEARQLCARLSSAGFEASSPLSARDLSFHVRGRSDPSRLDRLDTLNRSLAAASGRGSVEWGPMAVEADWFVARVDDSLHRSYRVAAWPMLPVGADWLGPLLTVDGVTRTVTLVLEPVPLAAAAADANRQLTSIEADQEQKARHGFRLTARERRRHDDVEGRERELAEGHPLFRHAAIVTVTAPNAPMLEEACSTVEQAASQSLLDLRPLAALQIQGWVASLPLGRSVKSGGSR